MVMRSTLKDTARRVQTHASRATLRKTNSKPQWSELDVDVMVSETHTGVEFIENYGTTSHPAPQEEDENKQQKEQQKTSSDSDGPGGGGAGSEGEQGDQPKGDSAEAIVLYLNGSRSHPVVISVGDRRHRLVELEEGDTAQHRLKDDKQQFLMSKDGTYLTTRNDKVMRIALVEKSQDDQQQQQAPRGGAAQQNGGGKKQKSYGQKSTKDDNKKSEVYIDQRAAVTDIGHGQSHTATRGSDASTYNEDRKRSTQVTREHAHLRTMDNRIFTDEMGCWSETPIQVKKDRYCKD